LFTAFLDTCVLWPSLQRDFLLSLAIEGMYRPVWSMTVLEELECEEARKLVKRGEDEDKAAVRASRLTQQMSNAFDDAEVYGWEGLEGTYGLPDPDDEHVVAAAVVGGAGAIITHNLRDFPAHRLPSGLEVIEPKVFAANTVALSPTRARTAVEAIADRSGVSGPPMTVSGILDELTSRYQMIRAADLIRQTLDY
jgi:PIN domain